MRPPRRWLGCLTLFVAASLTAASSPPTSRLGALRSHLDNRDFAQALEPRNFEFPADHGPHPEFRHEWWYVTGNLDGAGGERFGFELTFFRFALAPSIDGASPWRTRQIYMAHFAVTDVTRKRFHFAERLSREALGLAGAQARPFRVWLENWSMQESTGGIWHLHAGDARYSLELDLQALQAPVLNGDRGLSRKSSEPGAASYYYSIPRLAARGRLQRGTAAHEVSGLAWLDREWGSGALASDQEGWDWFALQLDDGSSLMFYVLRTATGRDAASAGTWMHADGRSRPLRGEELDIEVRDYWESPRGGRYPARWHLRSRSLALDIEVQPVLASQELGTNPRYWEGAVDVRGTRGDRDVAGRGYVELVGYAR
jgi:predicted secreted hydrolase